MSFYQRLLPKNMQCRIGIMIPTYITIHETSDLHVKRPASYNEDYYEKRLRYPKEGREKIGFHYLVSDTDVFQFLQDNVATLHCGNDIGNSCSIGIERLVNEMIDFPSAICLQAQLTATLMKKYNIPITHVVTHKYWSGKYCPARMLDGQYGGWDYFIKKVEEYYSEADFIDLTQKRKD